ncbi:hypothetical protein BGX38DRAFT_1328983 [Terfezia claveryi]|nr:hypothetical protein BGX38DRAFT_1328983 [Terfezia claveryi]
MLKRVVMEAQQQPQEERERERKEGGVGDAEFGKVRVVGVDVVVDEKVLEARRWHWEEEDLSPNTDEEHKELVAKRLQWLCDGIPELRELKEGKEELAEVERFELGQRVWKRESQFEKNAYKLRTVPEVTGKRIGYLRNPVNGARLRRYVDGEVVN